MLKTLIWVLLIVWLLFTRWQVQERDETIAKAIAELERCTGALGSSVEINQALREALEKETCGQVGVEWR